MMKLTQFSFSVLVLATFCANPALAADDPVLPERFSACAHDAAFDTNTTRVYVKCNDKAASDYYGRIWLSFSAPELDSSYADGMKGSEKQNFLKRVASLFVKNSKTGSLIAKISVSQNGGANTQIAVIELARFSRTGGGSKGFAISESSAVLNSFLGPTFIGNPTTTNVIVELQFRSLKKNKTAIVGTFLEARDAIAKVSLIRSIADIPQEARDALTKAENAIAATYDADTEQPQTIVLSFDRFSSNAVRKTVTFKGAADKQPGFLFVAVSRQPTILTEAPDPKEKLVYGDGRYSGEVANRILNQPVKNKTLRDYVREKMPETYGALTDGLDSDAFIKAAKTLRGIVESSDLGLNASDQTAAKWAFLAPSPLMTNHAVRKEYILANEERDGTLKSYGLGLPPVDPPALKPAEKAIVDEGEATANQARSAEMRANVSAERASLAAIETYQPGVAGNGALGRAMHRAGLSEYRGEPMTVDSSFYGVVDNFRWNSAAAVEAGEPSETVTGERYAGMLRNVGGVLQREGYGRLSFGGDAAKSGVVSYNGEFAKGTISGFGHMIWVDGSEFRGRFASGDPAGAGLYTSAEGGSYFVEYLGGVRSSSAVQLAADGKQIAGSWTGDAFKVR